MLVKVTRGGWHGGFPPLFINYWDYRLEAANGIITTMYCMESYEDGLYLMPDEDWSYDNPRWEQDEDCSVHSELSEQMTFIEPIFVEGRK